MHMHNLNYRMMAQYYTKIRLGRMATLLALTEAETEDCLSDMVGRLLILHLVNVIVIMMTYSTIG